MISEFSQMIHCMVLESPISARDLAKAVGKPYSTLLREINPYDSGAKLGVETYFQLLEKRVIFHLWNICCIAWAWGWPGWIPLWPPHGGDVPIGFPPFPQWKP